jgi:chorismate mutase
MDEDQQEIETLRTEIDAILADLMRSLKAAE